MDPVEIQAKAVIAAALISSHAVEVPRLPSHAEYDNASVRLRDLTDHIYKAITHEIP